MAEIRSLVENMLLDIVLIKLGQDYGHEDPDTVHGQKLIDFSGPGKWPLGTPPIPSAPPRRLFQVSLP